MDGKQNIMYFINKALISENGGKRYATQSCTDKSAEYYKQLYQNHLDQCSTLAEQLICLRSDLDKSNTILLKKGSVSDMSCPASEKKPPRLCSNNSSYIQQSSVVEELPRPIRAMPQPYKEYAGQIRSRASSMKESI
jgi:hypothetical protein